MAHMKLFYHFISRTAKTLLPGDQLADIYSRNAASCALENSFLMHQIMAISACHFSVVHPEQRSYYRSLGTFRVLPVIYQPLLHC